MNNLSLITSYHHAFLEYLKEYVGDDIKITDPEQQPAFGLGAGIGVTELGCITNDSGDIVGKAILCKTYVNSQLLEEKGCCGDNLDVQETLSEKVVAYFENGAKADPYEGPWEECVSKGKASRSMEPLCDVNGSQCTLFFRHIITDHLGEVTTQDTELDGSTPYVVAGTAGKCPQRDAEHLLLTETLPDGTVNNFMRHYIYDEKGTVIDVRDTLLDGTSPYQVTNGGTIGDSSASGREGEGIVLCDEDSNSFIRHFVYSSTGDVFSVYDTALDGTTPFAAVGAVASCAVKRDSETVVLCDLDQNGDPTMFMRHLTFDQNGNVSNTTDTQLDGTTAYVTAGTVSICAGASNVQAIVLCDLQADGSIVNFIRHISYKSNGEVDEVVDSAMDGVTAYVITGTMQDCATASQAKDIKDPEVLVLCDGDNNFLRHYTYDEDGELVSTRDTDFDGLTPFVPQGAVQRCPDIWKTWTQTLTDKEEEVTRLEVVSINSGPNTLEYRELINNEVIATQNLNYSASPNGAYDSNTRTYYNINAAGDTLYAFDLDNATAAPTPITLTQNVGTANFGAFDATDGLLQFGERMTARFRVNPADGTTVSVPAISGPVEPDFVSSISITRDGRMIAAAVNSGNLWEVNKATGVATQVGSVGIRVNGHGVDTTQAEQGWVSINQNGAILRWSQLDGSDVQQVATSQVGGNTLDVVAIEVQVTESCFTRCYTSINGVVEFEDVDGDGEPYTITGFTDTCPKDPEAISSVILCDITQDRVIPFIQHHIRSRDITEAFQTTMDGETIYTVVGNVTDCSLMGSYTTEMGCSNGTPFTRRTQVLGSTPIAIRYIDSNSVETETPPPNFVLGPC